jgi:Escherichia/Staphylococcus phage prohead protease
MPTLHKSYPLAQFKALEDEGEGVFEAIVSVFNNVDLIGDRVMPGAFTKSLDQWRSSGNPIPVIFSHQWENLDAHVGIVTAAEERPEGLYVKAQLDMEEDYAAKLWKRMKQRRIKEFSFAFDPIKEKRAPDGANDLIELDLIEVGPTLKGMNTETQLIGVKTGRVLSAKNEDSLKQAHDLIGSVLAQIASDEDKSEDKDETDNGKSEVLETKNPADLRLRLNVLDQLL